MKLSAAILLTSVCTAVAQRFMESCDGVEYIPEGKLVGVCQDFDHHDAVKGQLDLNYCLINTQGTLQAQDNGGAFQSCHDCIVTFVSRDTFRLECNCSTGNYPDEAIPARIDLNNIVTNLNGQLDCYGHASTPYEPEIIVV